MQQTIAVSFGRWLKERRKTLDLTQDQLARKVGCALITIKKLEADERRPSRQIAERLLDVLAVGSDENEAYLRLARGAHRDDHAASRSESRSLPQFPLPLTPLIGRARGRRRMHAAGTAAGPAVDAGRAAGRRQNAPQPGSGRVNA